MTSEFFTFHHAHNQQEQLEQQNQGDHNQNDTKESDTVMKQSKNQYSFVGSKDQDTLGGDDPYFQQIEEDLNRSQISQTNESLQDQNREEALQISYGSISSSKLDDKDEQE